MNGSIEKELITSTETSDEPVLYVQKKDGSERARRIFKAPKVSYAEIIQPITERGGYKNRIKCVLNLFRDGRSNIPFIYCATEQNLTDSLEI